MRIISMPRRVRIFVLLAVAVILAIGAWTVLKPPAPISFPLPNPNGYDDLVKAAGALTGDFGDYQTLGEEPLSALVATNTEALRLVRLGLTRTCSVPTDLLITNFQGFMGELPPQKRLAFLL